MERTNQAGAHLAGAGRGAVGDGWRHVCGREAESQAKKAMGLAWVRCRVEKALKVCLGDLDSAGATQSQGRRGQEDALAEVEPWLSTSFSSGEGAGSGLVQT